MSSSRLMRGTPILPPTKVRRPSAWSIAPTRLVVVVLPELPVIPTMGERHSENNSSTSLLRQDHEKIRSILKGIETEMNGSAKTSELEKQLSAILSDHEKTETSIIYPWLDQVIEEDAAKIVVAGMKNIAA